MDSVLCKYGVCVLKGIVDKIHLYLMVKAFPIDV